MISILQRFTVGCCAGVLLTLAAPGAAVAQTGVAGEWNGTLATPGATVPLQFIIQVKGDTLSGTVKRSTGDVALTGVVRGDSAIFSYTIAYNGNPFVMNLRGRVRGDTLSGIVDFGGGEESSWTTTRVKSTSTPVSPRNFHVIGRTAISNSWKFFQ